MKTLKVLLMALGVSLALSGCITIRETITLKKNGSGMMAYRIDMSGAKKLMEQFGGEETSENAAKSIDSMYLAMKDKLSTVKGVSGIANKSIPKDMIMEVQFKFINLESLNAALLVLRDSVDENDAINNRIVMDGKTITRYTSLANMNGQSFDSIEEEQLEMMKGFLEGAKYEYTLILPGAVKSATNSYSKVSGKTVTVSIPMLDILQNKGDVDMSTVIELK